MLNIYYCTWIFAKFGIRGNSGFVPYVCIDYHHHPEQGTIVLSGESLEKDANGNYEILSFIEDEKPFVEKIIKDSGIDYNLFNPNILKLPIYYDIDTLEPYSIKIPFEKRCDRLYIESLSGKGWMSKEAQKESALDSLNNKVEYLNSRGTALYNMMVGDDWDTQRGSIKPSLKYYDNGRCYGDTLKIKQNEK